MSQQHDALRIADALKRRAPFLGSSSTIDQAEKELLRLHSENEELKAKLTPLTPCQCVDIADLAAKLEFSDNFLSDICKIVELVEVAHGIVKP